MNYSPNDYIVVIPAYQCEKTIAKVVKEAKKWVDTVIVIDDGSTDMTYKKAKDSGAEVIVHKKNLGKGAALRTGIKEALKKDKKAVIMLDGDGQHDPSYIPAFIQKWEKEKWDIIIGTRFGNKDKIPRKRYLANKIGSAILSFFIRKKIEDTQSGFRLISTELLKKFKLTSKGYTIEAEILIRGVHRGATIGYVNIEPIYFKDGQSFYRPVLDTTIIFIRCVFLVISDRIKSLLTSK